MLSSSVVVCQRVCSLQECQAHKEGCTLLLRRVKPVAGCCHGLQGGEDEAHLNRCLAYVQCRVDCTGGVHCKKRVYRLRYTFLLLTCAVRASDVRCVACLAATAGTARPPLGRPAGGSSWYRLVHFLHCVALSSKCSNTKRTACTVCVQVRRRSVPCVAWEGVHGLRLCC
jgi:hypothetical protein